MKRILLAAAMALVLWSAPALAGPPPVDTDGDGVMDPADNCADDINAAQDDTDGDLCGNYCDADYDNNGVVGFTDYFQFASAFGTNDEEKCHTGTVPGCIVGFPQFFFFAANFGGNPGPSGTSPGTTACPAI